MLNFKLRRTLTSYGKRKVNFCTCKERNDKTTSARVMFCNSMKENVIAFYENKNFFLYMCVTGVISDI